MKKIPTLFVRDWDGDRSRVLDKVSPGCEWVIAGEGIATRKLDGSACLIRDHRLYKRRELRPGQEPHPAEQFELSERDEETGKQIGWVPVGDGPEDQWHREALFSLAVVNLLLDGTYELVGPKVQGNHDRFIAHTLVSHGGTGIILDAPRTYAGLRDWFNDKDLEGIVWHHPDGRLCKLKMRDFGLQRPPF